MLATALVLIAYPLAWIPGTENPIPTYADGSIAISMTYHESDFLPENQWTPEINAKVVDCWHKANEDCIQECGGSLLHATNFCRVLRSGEVVSFGFGCQMQEGYDSCVQTYLLRQEIQRLREELERDRKQAEQ